MEEHRTVIIDGIALKLNQDEDIKSLDEFDDAYEEEEGEDR